jgi:sugar phosphate isomerase/epimerase
MLRETRGGEMADLEIGLCCGTFMDLTLPELIELAGRHGFSTITARPWAYARALEAGWTDQRLRRLLADAKVRVTQMDCLSKGLPGAPSPDELTPELRAILSPDGIDPVDEAMVLQSGAGLEAPWINVSLFRHGAVPFEEMAEAIGGACRRAAGRGLGIALEFNPTTPIPDIGYAQRIAEACGEPNCKITLDYWHLDRSDGTAEDIRRLPPNALGGLQLNDRIRPPPGTPYVPQSGRSMPGEGELPLYDLVRAALENTPGISAEVEVFSQEMSALSADAGAARIKTAAEAWAKGL